MIIVNFWKNKQSGNYFSHKAGLTKEMVKELQALKEGDRLVLWVQQVDSETKPNLCLKVFKGSKNEL